MSDLTEAPPDGQRVVLYGEVSGRCSISPPPWISVRLEDGRIICIDAPFKALRLVEAAPSALAERDAEIARLTKERDEAREDADRLRIEVEVIGMETDEFEDLYGHDASKLDAALAELTKLRTAAARDAEEIARLREYLPESLREYDIAHGVRLLSMAYAGHDRRFWRYGYALRVALQFVDRAAGEGLEFLETEDSPGMDAADVCERIAKFIGMESGDAAYLEMLKPIPEDAEARLALTEREGGQRDG